MRLFCTFVRPVLYASAKTPRNARETALVSRVCLIASLKSHSHAAVGKELKRTNRKYAERAQRDLAAGVVDDPKPDPKIEVAGSTISVTTTLVLLEIPTSGTTGNLKTCRGSWQPLSSLIEQIEKRMNSLPRFAPPME